MWNLQDDNELDRLSREAAEGYSVDQSTDSWKKLEVRLDAELPEKRRRRYLLFFLLVLFVGSGAFWISRMNGNDELKQSLSPSEEAINKVGDANAQPENIVNPESKPDEKTIEKNNESEQATAPSTSRAVETGTTGRTVQSQQKKNSQETTSPNIISRNDISGVNKNVQTNKKKSHLKERSLATVAGSQLSSKQKHSPKKNAATGGAESLTNNQSGKDESVVKDENPVNASEQATQEATKAPEPQSELNAPSNKEQQRQATTEKKSARKVNSKWTLAAVYAPDISTVHFTHTQPVGVNIGLIVEYAVSSKFSIQTGAIYTKKNYKMNGEDYHPPKGYWTDYVNLEDVTGNCSMIDIPLNLRYNAVRKKSSNIFIAAGLSTYLMKQEEYAYYYYYSGTPTTRSKTYESNAGYPFSILNFSVGFEKKVSRTFSFQVEPFFKQTLTGVGFGDISLNSTGVYFSLRYNPLKKKVK
jgi:hypothetical protein